MTSWRSAVRVSYIPLSFHSLLAAAVLEIFPDVQILSGGEESIGFYRDFEFSQEFRPEFIPLIEERMKKILSKNPEIRFTEMVPQSARGVLERQGQFKLAEFLPSGKGVVVAICQIGQFFDLCLSESSSQLGAFAIVEYQFLENEATRLFGISARNPQELQSLLKKLKKYSKTNHQTIGEKLQLFTIDGDYCFYPKGIQQRQKILTTWSEQCKAEGFQEILPSKNFNRPLPFARTAQLLFQEGDIRGREKRFLGMLAPREYTEDRLFLTQIDLDSIISSLQFARKFSRIFGFDPEWVISRRAEPLLKQAAAKCGWEIRQERMEDPVIEWRLCDKLGRSWKVGYLRAGKEGVTLSLFYALERFIALLLENDGQAID